jgi:hypothetical protein
VFSFQVLRPKFYFAVLTERQKKGRLRREIGKEEQKGKQDTKNQKERHPVALPTAVFSLPDGLLAAARPTARFTGPDAPVQMQKLRNMGQVPFSEVFP